MYCFFKENVKNFLFLFKLSFENTKNVLFLFKLSFENVKLSFENVKLSFENVKLSFENVKLSFEGSLNSLLHWIGRSNESIKNLQRK